MTMLKVGEKVRLGNSIYRVGLVNKCRARLDLIGGGAIVTREFNARGKMVVFEAPDGRRHLDVSPTSFLERV